MSLFIISILAIFIIFFFLFSALILFGLSKLFKIENATYKNSIKILLFCGVVNLLISGFLTGLKMEAVINSSFLFILVIGLTTLFVFCYFFKRYYKNGWKKLLAIYFSFSILVIIFSLIALVPIRSFLVEPLSMKGNLMSPTLTEGDYLLIKKFGHNYQRGDIIAFYYNSKKGIFIRRIIGLPMERIEIINGNVLIDNEILNESRYYNGKTLDNVNLKLNADEYFVLRDNREEDLLVLDLINKEDIIGKIFFVIKDSEQRFMD